MSDTVLLFYGKYFSGEHIILNKYLKVSRLLEPPQNSQHADNVSLPCGCSSRGFLPADASLSEWCTCLVKTFSLDLQL